MKREEFLKQYKNVEFIFSKYWKHQFLYTATVDDVIIQMQLGDPYQDIYRSHFTPIETPSEYALLMWKVGDGNWNYRE